MPLPEGCLHRARLAAPGTILVHSSGRCGRNNAGGEPNGSSIFQNDTTWIHGAHYVRFGVETRGYFYNQDYRCGKSGNFTFTSNQTADPNVLDSTGFAFASFLLGAPAQTSLNITEVNPKSYIWNPAFYLADDWKVSRKLTLNLGLRWEIVGGLHEAENRPSGLDPLLPNPGAGDYPGSLVKRSTRVAEGPNRAYSGAGN